MISKIMMDDILVCFREHGDSAFLKPEFSKFAKNLTLSWYWSRKLYIKCRNPVTEMEK
jgi:hypothetical protein